MASKFVSVISPSGQAGEVPEDKLQDALSRGFRAQADVDAEAHQAALQEEYGGLGGKAVTAVQDGLRAATAGISSTASQAAQATLLGHQLDETGYKPPTLTPEARERMADPQVAARMAELGVKPEDVPADQSNWRTGYQAALQERQNYSEANPVTSGLSTAGGIAAPALLSGGASLLGRGAAATPAALTSQLSLQVAEQTAQKLGGGVMGRIAGNALGGATEGAVVEGMQKLGDELPNFTVDPVTAAEHVLASAGQGAFLGATAGGGLTAAGETIKGGAKLAYQGVKAAGSVAADVADRQLGHLVTPDALREMAGESAYKAVVGRTNRQAMRDAEKRGGASAVGQTLLDEGIPLAGSADEILAATSQKADAVGAELGAKIDELDQMGGTPIHGREIMNAIDARVLAPLKKNLFAQDIAADVQNKLKAFRGAMQQQGDNLSFDQVRNMRIDLDQTLAKWNQAGPPTPTTQALRDVRGALEDTFLDAAERSAKSVGVEGFAASVTDLKRRYAHLRLAADQAQEAVHTQLANRSFSPTDYGVALTGASLAGGPAAIATGLATGAAHRYLRQRGRGLAALALNQVADLAERKTTLAAMANQGQARLTATAQTLVQGAQKTGAAVRSTMQSGVRMRPSAIGAAAALSDEDFSHAIAEAHDLSDPNSDTSQQLASDARQMDMVNPGMGVAYANAAHARAQLITSKLPQPPSSAMFSPKPQLNDIAARGLRRTVHAAMDPNSALDRIAHGVQTPQDLEAIRTVYPAMYKSFQGEVKQAMQNLKQPPTYKQRLEWGHATGLPTDPSFDGGRLTRMQNAAKMPDQTNAAEDQVEQKNKASVGMHPHFQNADQVYAPRADMIMTRR